MRTMHSPAILLFICSFLPGINYAQPLPDSLSTTFLKQRSLEELMEMDITIVSKKAERLFDAPAAVSVLTNDDIRRSGASSIPEALRLTNTLQTAQKGAHAWGISARGFNTELANKLLVLIDGRTVYTPLYSGVFWERQDYLLHDIERIEIVRGPGSTVWGSNAVNGVINIITKQSGASQGWYAEAGGGTALEGFAGARYGGELSPGTTYRVYGKYTRHSGFAYSDGSDAPDRWRMGQGGFRVDAASGPEDSYTVQGDIYTTDDGLITGGTGTVNGGNILGRWTRTFSDASDLTVQLYYDRTELRLPAAPLTVNGMVFTPAGELRDNLDTYDLDFQHRFTPLADHTINWGFGYRFTHDAVQNAPALGFLPERLDQHLLGGFVQDEIALTEELFFTLGTKIGRNDYTGWEIEPGTRLQWKFSGMQTVWASVSRAVRTPSRIDRDMTQPAPPYVLLPPDLMLIVGGKNFRSETVTAYEAGYRAQPAAAAAFSVSLFYNSYDHLRSTSLDAVTIFPLTFENNLTGETYGGEVNALYLLTGWWRLHGGYALLKEDIRAKPGTSDFNKGLNETSDPQQQFLLRTSMDIGGVEFDATLRRVDRLPNYNGSVPGSVPAYSELDMRLGWHPSPVVELSITGKNLLQPRHPEYGFPAPTRREIVRSVYGKLACTL